MKKKIDNAIAQGDAVENSALGAELIEKINDADSLDGKEYLESNLASETEKAIDNIYQPEDDNHAPAAQCGIEEPCENTSLSEAQNASIDERVIYNSPENDLSGDDSRCDNSEKAHDEVVIVNGNDEDFGDDADGENVLNVIDIVVGDPEIDTSKLPKANVDFRKIMQRIAELTERAQDRDADVRSDDAKVQKNEEHLLDENLDNALFSTLMAAEGAEAKDAIKEDLGYTDGVNVLGINNERTDSLIENNAEENVTEEDVIENSNFNNASLKDNDGKTDILESELKKDGAVDNQEPSSSDDDTKGIPEASLDNGEGENFCNAQDDYKECEKNEYADASPEEAEPKDDSQDNNPEDGSKDGDSIEDTQNAQDAFYSDDDGYPDDEFSNIPDSFFDEGIYDSDDDTSISALLYDDNDTNATAAINTKESVSFLELKQEMQRIKEVISERHTNEDEIEEVENEDPDTEKAEESDTADNGEFSEEAIDEATDEIAEEAEESTAEDEEIAEERKDPEVVAEKKSYIREIERAEDATDEAEASPVTEHIITIDRSRVREKAVPEGRLIDTVFEAVELFTFAVLAIMMLLSFAFRHSTVSGESMYPTFNDGDRLIVSNLFYTPKRGDVVIFDDRSNLGYEDEPIIKRIIALEGDIVKIQGGTIYVKESGSDEFTIVSYIDDMDIPNNDMAETEVPYGKMFVMGDNVNFSMDSRAVGSVKVESIIGKVILRFYTVDTVYSEETQSYEKNGRIVFDTKFKN